MHVFEVQWIRCRMFLRQTTRVSFRLDTDSGLMFEARGSKSQQRHKDGIRRTSYKVNNMGPLASITSKSSEMRPTICTELAKINGLFRLVLSATTTTALRCMLPLLSPRPQASFHIQMMRSPMQTSAFNSKGIYGSAQDVTGEMLEERIVPPSGAVRKSYSHDDCSAGLLLIHNSGAVQRL